MRKAISLVLVLLLITTLSACGNQTAKETNSAATETNSVKGTETQKQSYKFKLGHEAQESHIKHMVAKKFKEELESRSNGRMTVDIFAARQLGTEQDMVQQLETGTLDFAIISNGYMSSRSESLNGWFMPFLFEDLNSAAKARKSEAAQQMLKELDSQGIVGLDVFFAGSRHLLMVDDKVESLADLKGKKIRVPGSPVFQEFWQKAGAGPTPMPLPEVYTSLQTGVIEGVDTDLDALLAQKYFEIAKYLVLTNHMIFPEVALASKSVFSGLDEEDQKMVKEAMEAAVEWGIQEGIKLETSRVEEVKQLGVNVTQFTDKDALKPIVEEMYKTYSEKNPVIKAFIEQNRTQE